MSSSRTKAVVLGAVAIVCMMTSSCRREAPPDTATTSGYVEPKPTEDDGPSPKEIAQIVEKNRQQWIAAHQHDPKAPKPPAPSSLQKTGPSLQEIARSKQQWRLVREEYDDLSLYLIDLDSLSVGDEKGHIFEGGRKAWLSGHFVRNYNIQALPMNDRSVQIHISTDEPLVIEATQLSETAGLAGAEQHSTDEPNIKQFIIGDLTFDREADAGERHTNVESYEVPWGARIRWRFARGRWSEVTLVDSGKRLVSTTQPGDHFGPVVTINSVVGETDSVVTVHASDPSGVAQLDCSGTPCASPIHVPNRSKLTITARDRAGNTSTYDAYCCEARP
jgi:hypothetical protein